MGRLRFVVRWLGAMAESAWDVRAEAMHLASIVGGWAALTYGVASLTVPEAWWLSLGLLLLSAAGWGHLRIIAGVGVYALTRKAKG